MNLSPVLITIILLELCLHARCCTEYYQTTKITYYYSSCGFLWLSDCLRTRLVYVASTRCCAGWVGDSCDILRVKSVNFSEPSGASFSVIQSYRTSLQCTTSEEKPRSTIQWYMYLAGQTNRLGTGAIQPTDKSSVANTVGTLYYWFSRSQTSGELYCTANNTASYYAVTSSWKTVFVLYPPTSPTFYIGSTNVRDIVKVIQGSYLVVQCRSSSNPSPPSYKWTNNNTAGTLSSQSIVFQNVSLSNETFYTCTATNWMYPSVGSSRAGISSSSFTLDVLYGPFSPTFSINGTDVRETVKTIQGSDLELRCESSSNPGPEYEWTNNKTTGNLRAQSLTILDVSLSDEAFYTCTAINLMVPSQGSSKTGTASSSFNLDVLYQPSPPTFSYNNTTVLDSIGIIQGSDLDVSCTSSSNPDPEYEWTNNKTSDILRVPRLTIQNVSISDATFYTCTATNLMVPSGGSSQTGISRSSFRLYVLYPPSSPTFSINGTTVWGSVKIIKGSDLVVKCVSSSNPGPAYEWTNNQTTVRLNVQNLIIQHVSLSDKTSYTCTATNLMDPSQGSSQTGIASSSFNLDVLYQPSSPTFSINETTVFNTVKIIYGSDLVVRCESSSNPEPAYEWTNNKTAVELNAQFLTIHGDSLSDETSYTCTATNMMVPSQGSTESGIARSSFNLKVLYQPSSPTFSINGTIVGNIVKSIKGSNLVVRCESSSHPVPEYEWTNNKTTVRLSGQVLTIRNVSLFDEAPYTCTATNLMESFEGSSQIGISSSSFNLIVLYQPSTPTFFAHGTAVWDIVKIIQGNDIVVICESSSNPEPAYEWTKNKTIVRLSGNRLTIQNVSLSDDTSYTCTATNLMVPSHGSSQMGISRSSFRLDVLYRPSPPTFSVNGTSVLDTVKIIRGNNLVVRCESSSNPESAYEWTNNKTRVRLSAPNFAIQNVNLSDESSYTCTASNLMVPTVGSPQTGISQSRFSLDVLYEPSSPTFSIYGKAVWDNVKIIQGNDLVVICESSSNPEPAYEWTNNKTTVRLSVNSLTILSASLSDETSYTCTATNLMVPSHGSTEKGISSSSFRLDVLYRPSPPTFSVNGTAVWDTVKIIQGNNLVVRCESTSNPGPVYEWINNKTRVRLSAQSLALQNVNRSDETSYTCTATNFMVPTLGSLQTGISSSSFSLDVLYEPSSPTISINGTVVLDTVKMIQGSDLGVKCESSSKPEPTYEWTNNRTTVKLKAQNLTIQGVSLSDETSYTCTASNLMIPSYGSSQMGKSHSIFSLVVLYQPSSPTFSINDTVVEDIVKIIQGNDLVVRCESSSNPDPAYEWTNNKTTVSLSTPSLTVQAISFSDETSYTCTATNLMVPFKGSAQIGISRSSFLLDVLYEPSSPTISINGTVVLDTVKMIQGSDLGIRCESSSNPEPAYEWTNNRTTVKLKAQNLTIQGVSLSDETSYTCTASNLMAPSYGSSQIGKSHSSFSLVVLYQPSSPTFSINGKVVGDIVKIIQGNDLVVRCESSSNPDPAYEWTNNKTTVSLSTQSLTVQAVSLSDETSYTCTATNLMFPFKGNSQIGISRSSFNLDVLYEPSSPTISINDTVVLGTVKVIQGSDLVIRCESSSNPEPAYEWTNNKTTVKLKAQNLTIQGVSLSDETSYTCTASNLMVPSYGRSEMGKSHSSFTLVVLYRPTSPTFSINGTVVGDIVKIIQGNDLVMRCESSSNPDPAYEWTNNKTTVSLRTQSLTVQAVSLSDETSYTCTATNLMVPFKGNSQIGISRSSFNLDVLYKTLVEPLQDQIIKENDPLSVPCIAHGNPEPSSLTWKRSRDQSFRQHSSDLIIRNTRRDDADIYICIASNVMKPTVGSQIVGTESRTMTVTILYHPHVVVLSLNGTTVADNSSNIILMCSAKGEPEKYIFYNWVQYTPDGSTKVKEYSPTSVEGGTAYLAFPKFSYMDSGIYSCFVENGIEDYRTGNVTATNNTVLIVQGRPTIINGSGDVAVEANNNATLWVAYYSNDEANVSVRWYKIETEVRHIITHTEKQYMLKTFADMVTVTYHSIEVRRLRYMSQLFIQNIIKRDFGEYEVAVSNSIGTTTWSLNLNEQVASPSKLVGDNNTGTIAGGATTGVLGLAVFILVVLFVRKRHGRMSACWKKNESTDNNGIAFTNLSAEGRCGNLETDTRDTGVNASSNNYVGTDFTNLCAENGCENAETDETYTTISTSRPVTNVYEELDQVMRVSQYEVFGSQRKLSLSYETVQAAEGQTDERKSNAYEELDRFNGISQYEVASSSIQRIQSHPSDILQAAACQTSEQASSVSGYEELNQAKRDEDVYSLSLESASGSK